MSVTQSTLSKLSVDPESNANEGLLMPKLQYRFRVNFENFGQAGSSMDLTRQVIDVARPQVQFDEITLNAYNSRVYLAGKHAWQPLSINIRDDASGNVSSLVGSQLQKQVDFQELASAQSGSDYKFNMSIQILDGGNGAEGPSVLENWDLAGCYLQQANYNALNYATSEAVTVSLTIRFDNANQLASAGSGGVGTIGGRGAGSTDTAVN